MSVKCASCFPIEFSWLKVCLFERHLNSEVTSGHDSEIHTHLDVHYSQLQCVHMALKFFFLSFIHFLLYTFKM